MLVLFETPAGYSLFKVNDEKKLSKLDADDIQDSFFGDQTKAAEALKLHSFQAFEDTADAVSAATAIMEGKVSKSLASFLKKKLKKETSVGLAVADKNLAVSLKESIGSLAKNLKIVHDTKTQELFRGIRLYMDEYFSEGKKGGATVSAEDMRAMQLGLSHSLSRYKLKFSADKVDTMVIQAVGLLDELDKEINTYAMRVKEWYGWHFPELQGLVSDNASYSRLVLTCGFRSNYQDKDLSSILEDEGLENTVKQAAEISMGTEIAELDIINISALAEQVLSMTEYRTQLFEYLKNRMNAIAPNLTILVGELVGARLIAHAGSLMNLAKQPASTVQILGAEKALFRALKTKHDTPKYGLIYHASLIGQAAPKNKGKISRVLAAKASLAIRVDALTDETSDQVDTTIGFEGRSKVEARLRQLEGGSFTLSTPSSLKAKKTARYDPIVATAAATSTGYSEASDMVLDVKEEDDDDDDDDEKDVEDGEGKTKKESKEKKKKKEKKSKESADDGDEEEVETKKKKSKKRKKVEEEEEEEKEDEADNGNDEDEKKSSKKKSAKKSKKEKRKSKD